MSTLALNSLPSKSKKGSIFKIQSYRPKAPLILFQEDTERQFPDHPSKCQHLHLPNIYKTENLLTGKGAQQASFAKFDKENQYNMPKIFKRNLEHSCMRKYQNMSKILTEQSKRQAVLEPIYHNFIGKKQNKKKVYMSKVIEKVISMDIQPWNLQQSNIYQREQRNNEASYPLFKKQDSSQIFNYEKSPLVGCNKNHRIE